MPEQVTQTERTHDTGEDLGRERGEEMLEKELYRCTHLRVLKPKPRSWDAEHPEPSSSPLANQCDKDLSFLHTAKE